MKKKIIDIELLCICGDSERVHTKMNKKSWDRLNKQIKEFEESNTIKNIEKFWNEFLTEGSQDEWKCSECDCEAFKMDNLKYLEEKYDHRRSK